MFEMVMLALPRLMLVCAGLLLVNVATSVVTAPVWFPGYAAGLQLALLVQLLFPPAPVHVALAALATCEKIPASEKVKIDNPQIK